MNFKDAIDNAFDIIKEMDGVYTKLFSELYEAKFFLPKENVGAGLNELADDVYREAKEHGWWDGDATRNVGEMIALMHSELSEALEEVRKGTDLTHRYYRESDQKPEGFLVELVDCVIRILDLVGWLRETEDVDFDNIIREKHAFNRTRPYKHNKTF